MKMLAVLVLSTAGLAFFGSAQSIKKVRATATAADSGPEMFKAYCASCHGLDGKGVGPAATALKSAPTDLTLLAHKSGGPFPSARVEHVLEGADDITAHGSTDMPLWGPVFQSLTPGNDAVVKLRIVNLTNYIKSLQK